MPLLSWSAAMDPDPEDAVAYYIHLGTSSNPPLLSSGNATAFGIPSALCLDPGTTYFWQVSARDSHNTETQGPVWQFTTTSTFEQTNTDGDSFVDACDEDDDNDGVSDVLDPFPRDPSESADTDGDGVGDNTDADLDGDGIPNRVEVGLELDPEDPSDAADDLDGDGYSNLAEYRNGSDIDGAASHPGNLAISHIKLFAQDGAANDAFGIAAALDGDVLVVGADEDDGGERDVGAAFVFARQGDVWIQQAKLTPTGGASGDRFGASIGLSGTALVVGVRYDDEQGSNAGAAYVYEYDDDSRRWRQTAKLLAPDGNSGDLFGSSVAIHGDLAVVGAPENNAKGSDSGAAYVFSRNGAGLWGYQDKLTASDGSSYDGFGQAVSIYAETIAVGAPGQEANGDDAGAVYVFGTGANGAWTQRAKLLALEGAEDDQFGFAVALFGDRLLVGSPGNDFGGSNAGSADLFTRSSSGLWTQTTRLLAVDSSASDQFGSDVALAGDIAVIGTRYDDDNGSNSGSAYVFQPNGSGVWSQEKKLRANDAGSGDELGGAVAVSGSRVLVGALGDDDLGSNAGAAYVFELDTTVRPSQVLTVTKSGTGNVTSSPSGISCGSVCTASFDTNTQVTLTAEPSGEYRFGGWSGDCGGTSKTCQVGMDGAKSVFAQFTLLIRPTEVDWQVTEIYIATMGYAADNEGLQYWVEQIQNHLEWTPTTVAQSFFDQPLVQAQYPAEQGYGALVDALYQNIFGRAADSDGYAYWLSELESGHIQRNQMIIALIEGGWANPEAANDMARFANRVHVSLAFTEEQSARGLVYSALSEADRVTLREIGRDLLADVTAEVATRENAIARVPGLLAPLSP
ncbi:DUF4214 domain-containing protein [Thiorhodococcus drewsii]|uniref:DUF4214 domain-containing protein n=1 Tax=Thiorhodococcus drewsii TaxID=210408 RepID=UPI00131F3DF7|nr:DUF4214 domain-containing protein [Thiorhodococcus drewsii]